MSGRIYDFTEFYVCCKCSSFNVNNAVEQNHNFPRCQDCNSIDVDINEIFNSHVFDKNQFMCSDGFSNKFLTHVDQVSIVKKKKEFLMEKYGSSKAEYDIRIRDEKINNLLK